MELCDVTIREGGQMPGRAYTREQKVAAAAALDELGLECIQVGFPAQGPEEIGDCEAMVNAVDTRTTVIARALRSDVDACLETSADVVEVIAPLSDRQLEHTIGKPRDEMRQSIADAVQRARDGGVTAHVVLVDAFRTETEHLIDIFKRFPAAERITLADSVGIRTPAAVRNVLKSISAAGVDLGRAGVHFHNDLGLATANTLVADRAGVTKVDVSVGSLGDRAGNTPVEQVVVARTIEDGASEVASEQLIPVCRTVLAELGESVSSRDPVLGAEVHTHEAGLHTAVMLDRPDVFEPYDPGAFGGHRELRFGAKTGRAGARKLLKRAGREPAEERIAALRETLTEQGPVDLENALDLAARVDHS